MRLVIYTKRMEAMVAFYCTHFGYSEKRDPADRIVELVPEQGRIPLLLHPAAKSMRDGQASVKLVFDVEDVEGFKAASSIAFGAVHRADGYIYTNAKDPSGNTVQISSRAFA